MLRKAWQPAFSSESLVGHLHLMDQVTGPGDCTLPIEGGCSCWVGQRGQER